MSLKQRKYNLRAKITLYSLSSSTAKMFFESIEPETFSPPSYRSRSKILYKKNSIEIIIDSKDRTSFRAALNSFLRFISMLIEVEETLNSYRTC